MKRFRGWRRGLAYWISPVVILLLWQLGSSAGYLDPAVLPGPIPVLEAGVGLADSGQLWPSVVASVCRILAGTGLGLLLGLTLGLLSGFWRIAEMAVDRPLQMLRAIPFNALTPLLIIAFGIGETMKVLLIVIGVVIPIYLNTYAGVRGVDARFLEVDRIYRVPRWTMVTRTLFLGAMPSILTGLRFSLAIAWIALVTSETVNTESGIGALLVVAQHFARTDQMLFCIVLYALLGLLTDWIVRILERRLLRWRAPAVATV
ncbi:MAG: ABC transporter permease [Microbacteriaceae bacterium]|jgi:sulfonate transport system permease protein|nr:ABC transporter permease [Microbacteriaceae bacterium]MCI1207321.1 ABC transporter permease [Microbacteriaceae bacterium]